MSRANLPAGYIVCPRFGHDRAFRPADGCPACARLSRAVRLVECLERAGELPAGTAAKARRAAAAQPPAVDTGAAPRVAPRPAPAPARAAGDGYDSKTERLYAAELERQRLAGEIVAWRHHTDSMVIGEETGPDGARKLIRYQPDFVVVRMVALRTPREEFHEVKHRRAKGAKAGLLKVQLAAALYPWRTFRLCERDGTGWRVSEIGRGDCRPTTAAPAPQPKGAKR